MQGAKSSCRNVHHTEGGWGGARLRAKLAPGWVPAYALISNPHRQCPGTGGERKADEYGEHNPLMAISPGGVAVAGSNRVTMTSLTVDVSAWVTVNRVVANKQNRLIRRQQLDDGPTE